MKFTEKLVKQVGDNRHLQRERFFWLMRILQANFDFIVNKHKNSG